MAQPVILPVMTRSPHSRENLRLMPLGTAAAAAPYGAIGTPAIRYQQSGTPGTPPIRYEVEGAGVERREPPMPKPKKSTPHDLPRHEYPQESRWQTAAPYFAEFLGTFLLVFTVATCAYTGSLHNDGSLKFNGHLNDSVNVKAPFAHLYSSSAIPSWDGSNASSSVSAANVVASTKNLSAEVSLAQQDPEADETANTEDAGKASDANGDGDGDGYGDGDGEGDGDGDASEVSNADLPSASQTGDGDGDASEVSNADLPSSSQTAKTSKAANASEAAKTAKASNLPKLHNLPSASEASKAANASKDTSASVASATEPKAPGVNDTNGTGLPMPAENEGYSQMSWTPTAIGCVVTVIIYAIAFVSGGHLNPAVSFAVFLARKMDFFKFVCYVIVQIFGGFLGGCLFEIIFLTPASPVMPKAPYNFEAAALIEIMFTAMLCFVVLNVTSSVRNNPENERNQFFALAIGFVLVAAGYAGANISGAVLNPAVALGLDLSGGWGQMKSQIEHVKYGFLYTLVELLGGLIGFILFRFCRNEDDIESSHDGQIIDDVSPYGFNLYPRMFSEFLGTFFLVVTFGLNVMMQSGAAAWSASAALLSLVYALGDVSGGHFNPAVTAAVVLGGRNKCSFRDGRYYVLMQLLAAIFASWVLGYVHHHGPTADTHFMLLGMTGPSTWGAVAATEIIFTFLLVWVVLAVSTADEYRVGGSRSRQNFYFALAIGFTMFAGSYASSTVSGGYLNPSIALGIAIDGMPPFNSVAHVKGWPSWSDPILQSLAVLCKGLAYLAAWLLYVVFELIGAFLAAGVFHITHPAEYQKGMSPLMPLWSNVKEEGS